MESTDEESAPPAESASDGDEGYPGTVDVDRRYNPGCYLAIGAVFAYTYAHLAGLGVEIMAASQVTTATCTRLAR